MKPKLMCCCSSRIRPDRIREMLKSFIKTKTPNLTKMIIYIDEKDPRIEEYREVIKEFSNSSIRFIIGPHKYMVEVINYISTEIEPDIAYYQNICDDHVYIKKGWDKLMLKPLEENGGWGVAFILDNADPTENPTAEIISGKIVRTLKYFYFPQYRQYGLELYIAEIGINAGYFCIGRDLIEHKCEIFKKALRDANANFIYSQEEKQNGINAYPVWQQSGDIEKIKRAMEKEGIDYLSLSQLYNRNLGVLERIKNTYGM